LLTFAPPTVKSTTPPQSSSTATYSCHGYRLPGAAEAVVSGEMKEAAVDNIT
jgi:hypothetical protein